MEAETSDRVLKGKKLWGTKESTIKKKNASHQTW